MGVIYRFVFFSASFATALFVNATASARKGALPATPKGIFSENHDVVRLRYFFISTR